MIELIHNAMQTIEHWRDTRRVRRACRMSVAQLETFYEYYKSNGGFSRNGTTPTINQGDIRAAGQSPQQTTDNQSTN